MANTTTTLNPFAPPYHKLPYHHHHHHHQPHNPHFHTPRKVLSPIPCGPRVPTSRRHRRRSQLPKPILQWQPKQKPTQNIILTGKPEPGFQGIRSRKQRWKSQTGGYHQLLPMDHKTTSVMIRNIPQRYTRDMLILTLDNHCKKFINETGFVTAYDYLYLPIDFKRRLNAGFAFVNFTNPRAAMRFKEEFDGKHWALFYSSKVAQITKAKIQGKKAIKNFYKNMDFTGGLDEDLPVLFEPARDGSGHVSKMIKLGKN